MQVFGINVLKELDIKRIKKVYTSRKEVIEYCQNNKITYEYMDNNHLNKFTKGNHQGVIIDIYDYEYYSLDEATSNFILCLDHLEDPHNFGAIIRSAVGAGIDSIIIPKDRSVKVTDNNGKENSTEGTLDYRIDNKIYLKTLQKKGYFVYAADMHGEDYQKIDYAPKKVLVIGNEGEGISRLVKEVSDVLVRIPIDSRCESLNASVAAGILIYEMRGN